MEQNVVVIGANGFVGSHLVDYLSKTPNVRIVCFDRFSRPPAFKTASNISIVRGDFFNEGDIDALLLKANYLVHCFSSTTPQMSDNDPYVDLMLLKRSVEIFEKSMKSGAMKKVIFISSGGAVYGETGSLEPAQETSLAAPISPYGIAKLASEQYLEYFKRKYDKPYVVCRLANPYGPGQIFKNGQGVIPTFIDKAQNSEKVSIYGDGKSSRDYIYIDDAVNMISRIILSDNKYSTYNIGSGSQTTLTELLSSLEHVLGRKIDVEYKHAPKTFLSKAEISIKRFEDEYGLPNFIGIEDGLRETVTTPKTVV